MVDKRNNFRGIAKDFINAVTNTFIGKGADPNDIFVQDLFNYEPPQSANSYSSLIRSNKDKLSLLMGNNTLDRRVYDQLLNVFNTTIKSKRELLNQSRMLFDTDIVQIIIDVMIDDGFGSFINDKDEFRIGYELPPEEKEILGESYEQEINAHIDEFVEKFAIKRRIPELIPELLRDGEYAWGCLFEENKGITEIVDDLDVIDLLPFYESDKLVFVMKQKQNKQVGNGLTGQSFYVGGNVSGGASEPPIIYKPDNIIFFRLKYAPKQKIDISEFYDAEYRQKFLDTTGIRLPKYIRACKPIYYSAIKNLNRLQVLENVNTILDLYDILKPDIVTVSVPSTTTSVEAQTIVRDFERQLNDMSAFTDVTSLDMTTLASLANRRKVLPTWLDGKGQISASDLNTATKGTDTREGITFLRNLIAMSVGIPPYYINMSETPIDKAQSIKLYSRYTKKLISLQKSISDGVVDAVYLHLTKKGFNISRDNLYCKFVTITCGDSLDDTDMMVATITGVNEMYKGLEEISSSEYNELELDSDQFKIFYDSITDKYMNISSILRKSETKLQDNYTDKQGTGGPSGDIGYDTFDDFQPDNSGEDDSYAEFEANSEIEPNEDENIEIETNVEQPQTTETPPAEEG